MNGFLNVLKPPGMTSAAVVAVVRRLTGEKRVGHAGTLDPEAAGVLPVMVGRAARLFDYLADKEKTYVAECAFGAATDTQDASGRVTARGEQYPSLAQVRQAADALTGDIWQRPSAYSAIKQGGKPLYERARSGEEVQAPLRQVHIERIQLLDVLPHHGVLMQVDCGRGTYIRSLCSDLGEKVGCPAHMRFLLRTRTGAFLLENALTLEELQAHQLAGTLHTCLCGMDMPLQHLPRVDAPAWLEKQVRNGVRLPLDKLKGGECIGAGDVVRIYCRGAFWGIGAQEENWLVWRAQLPPDIEGGKEHHADDP